MWSMTQHYQLASSFARQVNHDTRYDQTDTQRGQMTYMLLELYSDVFMYLVGLMSTTMNTMRCT